MQQPTDTPKLADAYAESLPASRALYDRAKKIFPDGVTHDTRRMQPFPIYVERAEGAYKWDVDGNRYIDYWMGHGALLLRAQPAPHPRRRERGRTPGLALRGRPQAGGGMGRMGEPSGAVRRAGALHRLGHRGDAYGAEARARLHRQKARGEIRGPFPRLARGARDRRARPLHERARSRTTRRSDRLGHRMSAGTTSRPFAPSSPRTISPRSSWSRPADTSAPSR